MRLPPSQPLQRKPLSPSLPKHVYPPIHTDNPSETKCLFTLFIVTMYWHLQKSTNVCVQFHELPLSEQIRVRGTETKGQEMTCIHKSPTARSSHCPTWSNHHPDFRHHVFVFASF